MADGPEIQYEGFSEIYRALHDLEPATHEALREGLLEVGNVARERAVQDFSSYGGSDQALESHARTAEGFKTRVRATGLVVVEQTIRKTTGLHPEYGGLMMTKALLPARAATLDEATAIVERKVVVTLHRAGF
jgi:hypothetical protein